MRHPHLFARAWRPHTLRDGAFAGHVHEGAAEFAMVRSLDDAAQLRGHGLLPVAYAHHRHAQGEDAVGCAGAAALVHRGRPAGQDDAPRGEGADARLGCVVVGPDLAIDAGFAQAPRDQLRHLAPEIQDQDVVVAGGGGSGGVGHGGVKHGAPSRASRRNQGGGSRADP